MKKRQWLALSALLVLVFSSCQKEKYSDSEYGSYCYVSKFSISPQSAVTTFDYGQDGMISSVNMNSPGNFSAQMTVTYNNNTAFSDFRMNGTLIGWSEAPLDSSGNMLSTINTDSSGQSLGDETYVYNADHQLIEIAGYDFFNHKYDTLHIQYTQGNPTTFSSSSYHVRCNYNTNQKSSFRLGKGNVALQAQKAIQNIAMLFSTDLLKTFDLDGSQNGQPMNLSYDFDSDGKVRKIFWSTTSSNSFGTTTVDYDCYQ